MAKELEVMSKNKPEVVTNNYIGNTDVFIEEFKGNLVFSVFQVDEHGKKAKDRPEVAVGMHKAKALVKHSNELTNWVNGIQGK